MFQDAATTMSFWLKGLELEEPDDDALTEGLLLSDGSSVSEADTKGGKETVFFFSNDRQMAASSSNREDSIELGRQSNKTKASNSRTTANDTDEAPLLRCQFCLASVLLLLYSMALLSSVLDLFLGLDLFPVWTVPLLITILLLVLLSAALYLIMPILVAVNEIYLYERSLLAGTRLVSSESEDDGGYV